jgi:DNA-binding response OmpR family regulator
MGKNVLLIDSEEYNTSKIDDYLKFLGCETVITKNGQFGLARMRNQKPDLIIISDTLNDIGVDVFLERKSKMIGAEMIPVFVMLSQENVQQSKLLIRKGAKDVIGKPIVLDRFRKKLLPLLNQPDTSSEKHLVSEVFVRDGIIVIEIGGHPVSHEIISMKHVILDTARSDQTLTKRFYVIIYSLEDENVPQPIFDSLFDFVSHFPGTPNTNVKILTSNDYIKGMLEKSITAHKFEIVDNYINGLNKLKDLYLEQSGSEILVEFLKPNITLYKSVYDQKGELVKKEGSAFTAEELKRLLDNGVKKLFYTRTAKMGDDQQISADEDVDLVMDSIQVTGVVIPQDLTDVSLQAKSDRQTLTKILISNSNPGELDTLSNFFSGRGFSVDRAINSKEAIQQTTKKNYNYIIVDLDLDSGNGLNLVQSLKIQNSTKSAKFIVTGRNVTQDSVSKAVQLGVKGFLKSPFDPEQLSKLIK